MALSLSSHQVGIFFCGAKANVLGYFRLSFIVREDEGVVPRVASVEEGPSFSRICGVFELFTQWWVNGDGGWSTRFGDSGVVSSSEGLRWVTLDAITV